MNAEELSDRQRAIVEASEGASHQVRRAQNLLTATQSMLSRNGNATSRIIIGQAIDRLQAAMECLPET